MVRVAIDAMGGDFGYEPIINGVLQALEEKSFNAILVGDRQEIEKMIPDRFSNNITYIQADEMFSMASHATDAIKNKETTIYKAIELLKNGECDGVVSAGHSGATMSLATLRIGRLKNVLRPAIATLMPSQNNKKTLMLDVGANVDCKAEHLFQFAVMGEAYAKEILGIQSPKIGLLSNGEEESKGNDVTKEAFLLLKNLDSFIGNVEGGQIFDGSVDVVVCDGFIGNLVLKTSEGVASSMTKIIKTNIKESFISIIGAFLMKKVFKNIKRLVDYDEYGGAPLIGVKNCVIISHGKSSPKAIKNAIFQAIKFSDSKINNTIENELAYFAKQ
ncbi:phosphate acyltransferase PlsX [Campylobacter sp. RM12327]|uniref:phosphate acyltransferase PlsX n=1 Tax=Campylobacter sputorum TaxID=206 RepID=UPI00053BEBDF|nr:MULTISPECIES: phosphate acyltransferase PlsX [Campylobacter]ASM40636.1 acyl phosphate synthase [Campylobacter sputorum]MBE7357699.1 phosphate acyltransferase PlsX [Campylobacter sp. RM11302]MBF6668977.1 phosphate acyltransferase PlsX [Campylobacter sp. RM12327]MBF6674014.1 phosphate acyltransferase PlsX [Campylobacter sp. RM13538]MBF6675917.1 phosphate acyltransferase PlsX [Campylobacter sp. RM12321]